MSGSPFSMGERVAFGGLALGGLHGIYGSTSVPPLMVGMDRGIFENISAGGTIVFSRYTYTYIPIVARANYHTLDPRQGHAARPLCRPRPGIHHGHRVLGDYRQRFDKLHAPIYAIQRTITDRTDATLGTKPHRKYFRKKAIAG